MSLLANHFVNRLTCENFIIYDEKRNLALVYNKSSYYITDVDKCIMETENKFLGVTIYSPLSKIKELENKYNFKYNIKVTPFISDFSKEEFKDTYDFNDYISKSLTYYESLGLKLITDKTYITIKEDIKIFNKITKYEYFKIDDKNNQIMTKTPFKSFGQPLNPLRNEIYVANGGTYYIH